MTELGEALAAELTAAGTKALFVRADIGDVAEPIAPTSPGSCPG